MRVLVIIATLFVIGSMTGYVIELFFRRFVSQKRWVNPGFMVGPYIPLYGFGVVILYSLSNIQFNSNVIPQWAQILIILGLIGVSLTLIELIAGLIFIKCMHLKLWDYSNRWGNFKGLICPAFSLAWLAVGSLYFFFINPLLVKAVIFVYDYQIYDFFIGIVVGMMIVDLCYSIHLGMRIRKFSENTTIRFEKLKISAQDGQEKKHFFTPLRRLDKDSIKKFFESSFGKEQTKKWWKKKKDKESVENK